MVTIYYWKCIFGGLPFFELMSDSLKPYRLGHITNFASFPWKSVKIFRVERMGWNFDDYSSFMKIVIIHYYYLFLACNAFFDSIDAEFFVLFFISKRILPVKKISRRLLSTTKARNNAEKQEYFPRMLPIWHQPSFALLL